MQFSIISSTLIGSGSYRSEERQSAYSTAPVDWAGVLFVLFLLSHVLADCTIPSGSPLPNSCACLWYLSVPVYCLCLWCVLVLRSFRFAHPLLSLTPFHYLSIFSLSLSIYLSFILSRYLKTIHVTRKTAQSATSIFSSKLIDFWKC